MLEFLAKAAVSQRKIVAPPSSGATIRDRLDRLLEEALEPSRGSKLVLVIAPASYGKTVALASHLARTGRKSHPLSR